MRLRQTLCVLILWIISSTAFGWSLPFFHGHNDTASSSAATQAGPVLQYVITGLPPAAEKNALSWLKVDAKNIDHALSTKDMQELYQQAPDSIKQAIQPYGFFKAQISSQGLKKINDKEWQATFHVAPGPPLRITSVQVQIIGAGAQKSFFQRYLKTFPLKKGHVLNTEIYDKAKKRLNNIATNHGYLAGHFTVNTINIDLSRYTGDIILTFDTGPQYYFGQVIFHQTALDDGLLQRYVRFNTKTPYSPDDLLRLQQSLSSTPYFQSVDVEPDEQNATNLHVPVNVNLTPSKSQKYNFGVGYGTDTGFRGTIGWTIPRVTRSGQYFNTNLQASQIQTSLDARYVIPGNDPINQQYYIGGTISQESPNTSEGQTEKITVGKTNVFDHWKTNLSLSEQFDQYSLRGDPWRQSHLLLPSLTLSRMAADDPVFPRFGYNIALQLQGAAQQLASSTSFFQTELSGNFIFSPTQLSRVVLRGNVGITAVNNIDNVPLSLQYFAGGSDSVRGYSYQELGPGRYLLVGSIEFQHQIVPKWFGAVFFDTGNAVNSLHPAGDAVGKDQPNIILSDLLKASTGIGVIWVSPVGPVELTLAKPLTDPGKSVALQFTMGTGL